MSGGALVCIAASVLVAGTAARADAPPTAVFPMSCSTVCPPVLGALGGVMLDDMGYGSGLATVPGSNDEVYGITDRGPNVDGPAGTKVLPLPHFTPSIGKFKINDVTGQAEFEQNIPLQAADGTPYDGLISSTAPTGETFQDLAGNPLVADPNGYDPEGIVALPDGTFWISDEYGPFITHFDATGTAIGRLSPLDGTLPHELANRNPNQGMEGLTITPDGTTLIGSMQSALVQPDLAGANAKKISVVRIVTVVIATGEQHEYVYLLDEPGTNAGAISEITALSATSFIVDERDGKMPPHAYKKLWKIDLSGATDIGPATTVAGATYDPTAGGLLIQGTTLEGTVLTTSTAAATATLQTLGITPVHKALFLDLGALVDSISPTGQYFAHDKIEGLALLDDGNTLIVSNDSDFAIDGLTNTTPPYQLHQKVTSAGAPDHGELLRIDLTALNAPPADVPEAPVPVLLTLSAIAIGAGLLVIRRRRVPA